MNNTDIDTINERFTKVLKPRRVDKSLMLGTVLTLDTEYRLPIHIPYSPEKLAEKLEGAELPSKFTELREPFLSFCLAHKDFVARWKPDRPIELQELLTWILGNLKEWNVTPESNRVIVCSHFLISELQHIQDLRESMIVRKFGSGTYGELDFKPDQWEDYNPPDYNIETQSTDGKIKFRFIDTYVLFGMSLEKLTDGTPYQKPKDEEIWHGKPWKYWRANPHLLFKEDEKKFWSYAEADVFGLWWCVDYWRKWVWDRWHLDILRCRTFSNIGLRIFQSQISEPTEPYKPILKLSKDGRPRRVIEFDHDREHIRKFYLRLYKAGYRVSFVRGLVSSPVYAYDIVKLYTTAAIMQPLPNARTEFLKISDSDDLEQYEGAVEVEFEFPAQTQYPTLPITSEQFPKMICPLRGREVESVAAVRLAKRLGAKIHIIDSCVFRPTESEINHPLRKVLQEILTLAKEGKGTPQERFMKNIANGVIGKMFQRNRIKALESWRKEKSDVTGSWSPILSALILAKGQCILFEIMQLGVGVYTHTDSFFTTTPIDQNAPILQELRKYGSGLDLQETYHEFWTPRSAVRYGVTKDGKVEVARGGISSEHENFGEIVRQKIGNLNAPNRTCFIALKMATLADNPEEQKHPLGHEVLKIIWSPFDYDHKRKPLNPTANLWTEHSETAPWTDIKELLENVTLTSKKTGKTETLATGFRRVREPTGGRPRVIDPWDHMIMLSMIADGLTRNEIAKRFQDKYSRRTVYRDLDGLDVS